MVPDSVPVNTEVVLTGIVFRGGLIICIIYPEIPLWKAQNKHMNIVFI